MGFGGLLQFLQSQPPPEAPSGTPRYRRSGIRGLIGSIGDFLSRDPDKAAAEGMLANSAALQGEADAAGDVASTVLGENTPLDQMGPPPPSAPSLQTPSGVEQGTPDAAGSNPASRTTLASKVNRGELVAAAAPEAAVRPAPQAPARPTGKNGEPLYTNEDLAAIHQHGPQHSGFGSFSTPDSETEAGVDALLGQAMKTALARGKAIEQDPTGIKTYGERKKVEQDYGQKTDRDVFEAKQAAHDEYQQKRRAIQAAAGRTQEQKDAALEALRSDYEEFIASVDSRFRRQ